MKALVRNQIEGDREFPIRILQFGGGNFLRAFTGWMVEILNEVTDFGGDIAVVKPTARGSYSRLKQQQGLYHVLLKGIKDGQEVAETKRIHCIRDIVNPYAQWNEYLRLAELPTIRFVISNTTEAGIKFDPDAEMNGKVPEGFPAKLTLWLYHRYRFFNGEKRRGCIFLPCELIEDNGIRLSECVLQHAGAWDLEDGFAEWLRSANFFCNTLVDRIVSGFPEEAVPVLHQQLGFLDNLLVSGEYYHSWVIQGPGFLPTEWPTAQTDLNVLFVENLRPYREMKVRILNATHSIMVPVGCLMGLRFVHECMQDEALFYFLQTMLSEEISPTLDLPVKEVKTFREATFNRFQNPSLNHRLESIALNSMAKFNTRVIPVLMAYFHKFGRLPQRIVLSLAAQICFYRGSMTGEEFTLTDSPETLSFFNEVWKSYDPTPDGASVLVSKVLSNHGLWSFNLADIPGLHRQLASCIYLIESKGMAIALTGDGVTE
jgi:tagaturonate reductase